MSPRSESFRLLAVLGLGALAFAAGLACARAWLPEWRAGDLPDRSFFVQRYQELTERIGFTPDPYPPMSVRLATHETNLTLSCASPDEPVVAVNTRYGAGVCVEVSQRGTLPGETTARDLVLELSGEGTPRAVLWTLRKQAALTLRISSPQASSALQASLLSVLLPPGQRLGPPRRGLMGGIAGAIYPLVGRPEEHVFVQISQVGSFLAFRQPGDPKWAYLHATGFRPEDTLDLPLPVLFTLGTMALFFVLLGRGRIDLVNGASLAALSFLALTPALPPFEPRSGAFQARLIHIVLWTLWVLVVWSAGESLLRSQRPKEVSSLDALRSGHLGPRGGRAVLIGLGTGIGLGGLRLAILAAAAALPHVWPALPSAWLPFFDRWSNPIVEGVTLAGTVALATAIAGHFLPARWAPLAASLATALLTVPLRLGPLLATVVVGWAFAAILVRLSRNSGLAAVLVAAVTQILVPTAAYAAFRIDWLPGTFAASSAILLAFFVLGLAGLSRAAEGETERLRPPAFMRRIEEERRLKYEMDLLARMQEGLLPRSLPGVPGWQIAARSILATEAGGDLYDVHIDEAGGLWIAVGDVAGHGYSCVIVQAMVISAVSSFIAQGRSPAEVLQSVDRVIRRGQTPRNFTTLALLRIDPRTGEAVLANAGHPYPLLCESGKVSELSLPGLPLGQGPERVYREHAFPIPPGSALLLYSDGLVESCDESDVPFGFERPQEVLRKGTRASAADLVDIVISAWRHYLGEAEPPDDTTVLVIKRSLRPAAARV